MKKLFSLFLVLCVLLMVVPFCGFALEEQSESAPETVAENEVSPAESAPEGEKEEPVEPLGEGKEEKEPPSPEGEEEKQPSESVGEEEGKPGALTPEEEDDGEKPMPEGEEDEDPLPEEDEEPLPEEEPEPSEPSPTAGRIFIEQPAHGTIKATRSGSSVPLHSGDEITPSDRIFVTVSVATGWRCSVAVFADAAKTLPLSSSGSWYSLPSPEACLVVTAQESRYCSVFAHFVEGRAPSCTEDGCLGHYHCSYCGNLYADAACTEEITDLSAWQTGPGRIPAAGHSFDREETEGEITVPASHLSEGVKTFTCTDCSETVTEPIPKLPEHTFNLEVPEEAYLKSAANCTEAAVYYKSCACGEADAENTFLYGSPLGHRFGEAEAVDAEQHKSVCAECGHEELEAHTFSGNTCTECGYEKIAAPTSPAPVSPSPVPVSPSPVPVAPAPSGVAAPAKLPPEKPKPLPPTASVSMALPIPEPTAEPESTVELIEPPVPTAPAASSETDRSDVPVGGIVLVSGASIAGCAVGFRLMKKRDMEYWFGS